MLFNPGRNEQCLQTVAGEQSMDHGLNPEGS